MKKRSTCLQSSKGAPKGRAARRSIRIGMDLGDKSSRFCCLDKEGTVEEEGSVAMTKKAMLQAFGGRPRVSHCGGGGNTFAVGEPVASSLGYEVIVANARQVKLISQSSRKDDRLDARTLARLARVDPQLLRPIRHRSEEAQLELTVIRARAALVKARTDLVNAARGLAKAMGERLPSCDTDSLGPAQLAGLPEGLQQALRPLLQQVQWLTVSIKERDQHIEQIARTWYPETKLLRQISGVGPLIALTFVLTLDDPQRFAKRRDVGCYVGLRPKRSDSGERQPQLGITKEGDIYLRKLLVQGAQHILHRGPDTDLKRWGLKLAARGGKNARKRALVAVARKLGILLHRLWVTGVVYEPLQNSQARQRSQQASA
jgi:transposase